MLSIADFRHAVVRPALTQLGLWSEAAENLLIGTAVQESGLRHLVQLAGGPARGIYQVEPASHDDIWASYLSYRPELARAVAGLAAPVPSRIEQLATNLAYATAIARIVYLRRPEPLPAACDVEGLACYWKRYFNTERGHGSVPAFILNYKEFVK